MNEKSVAEPQESRIGRIVLVALGYSALIIVTLVTLVPFFWMISSSFKPSGEIFTNPPTIIPQTFTLENYRKLFSDIPFTRFFVNTVFVATSSTLLTLFFCSLAGFSFAKYEFRGKTALFSIVLASMMVPFQVLLVPLFYLMHQIGWIDSYWAVIVPFAAGGFGIFLMRQYMLSVPDDLIDAARIDGCSEFGIYWRVVLPVIKPVLGALTIFVFMGSWNNFLWPRIVLRDESKYTLPIGLANLVGVYQQEYGILMAGTVLSILPIVILFLFMQKEFVEGITLGAVKE